MKNLKILTAVFGIVALFIAGCSNNQNPLDSSDSNFTPPPNSALISLPAGAVLNSATMGLYAEDFAGTTTHNINVHRVTAPWDEYTVTYNSFAGSYDPTPVATISALGTGWYTADITSLVQDWLDGVYPDYGVFIQQPEDQYTRFASSEYADASLRPYLEICYTLGGVPTCITIQRGSYGEVADAVILEIYPNANAGGSTQLYTVTLNDLDKHSLLKFDVEVVVQLAAIGDFVWIDQDMDGIQDVGEPGFPGVTVNLYDCDDVFIASTTTDENGYYLFDGLMPGDYYVEFEVPEGHAVTLQDQGGDDTVDSDADPITGMTICTTLDPDETDLTWDCGLYLVEQTGCTLTIGYWRTHGGFGPQDNVVSQYLPIWLGDAGGSKSIAVTDSVIAHDILIMHVYGHPSNGITKLYAQMLGAKLNIEAGADPTDVAATIAAADAFLAMYDYTDWNSLDKSTKNMVIGWMSDFDDYNNGDIGPGHCDD